MMLYNNPIEFNELWEVFRKYIEHCDESYAKTLSFECLIHFVQNNFYLQSMLTVDQENLNENRNYFISLLNSIQKLAKTLDASKVDFDKVSKELLMTRHLDNDQYNDDLICSDPALIIRMISKLLFVCFHLQVILLSFSLVGRLIT